MDRRYKWKRLWYWLGSLGIGVVAIFSLIPVAPELPVNQGDKLQHLLAYAALAYWFGMLAGSPAWRMGIVIALATLGLLLEYLQGIGAYRCSDVGDMMANACGAGLGALCAASPGGRLLVLLDRQLSGFLSFFEPEA